MASSRLPGGSPISWTFQMFLQAAHARREIARTFAELNYDPEEETWRSVAMGVKRDLQARLLRPNVSVPPRRRPVAYLRTMRKETGSILRAFAAILHDGAWTSSGGSFRLAEEIGVDVGRLAADCIERQDRFTYLEIGAGWAGMESPAGDGIANIAGLARRYSARLGKSVHLHMTNLTQWHDDLPAGVAEHPYVTASALSALVRRGIEPASVDLIYSQAAAYFETDLRTFIRSAAALLSHGGTLVFNYPDSAAGLVWEASRASGLIMSASRELGGMNGIVARFDRPAPAVRERALAERIPPGIEGRPRAAVRLVGGAK